MFSVISGRDEKDGTSCNPNPFTLDDIKNAKDLKGKKIGIPSDYFGEGIDLDVAAKVKEAAEVMKSLGAEIEEFSMPIVKYAIPTYYIIACAEACSNLSRFDGIKYGYKSPDAHNLRDVYFKSRSEGFGMEVKKRIMLGNFVLSSGYFDAYYNKALKAKGLIVKAFNEAFEKYDFLLGPVAPTTALEIGKGLSDPLAMYLGDIYTVMINIAGLPSLALPCGFDGDNMPVGMQLIGRPFDEKQFLPPVMLIRAKRHFIFKSRNWIKEEILCNIQQSAGLRCTPSSPQKQKFSALAPLNSAASQTHMFAKFAPACRARFPFSIKKCLNLR